jgi:hypothetical protein
MMNILLGLSGLAGIDTLIDSIMQMQETGRLARDLSRPVSEERHP